MRQKAKEKKNKNARPKQGHWNAEKRTKGKLFKQKPKLAKLEETKNQGNKIQNQRNQTRELKHSYIHNPKYIQLSSKKK